MWSKLSRMGINGQEKLEEFETKVNEYERSKYGGLKKRLAHKLNLQVIRDFAGFVRQIGVFKGKNGQRKPVQVELIKDDQVRPVAPRERWANASEIELSPMCYRNVIVTNLFLEYPALELDALIDCRNPLYPDGKAADLWDLHTSQWQFLAPALLSKKYLWNYPIRIEGVTDIEFPEETGKFIEKHWSKLSWWKKVFSLGQPEEETRLVKLKLKTVNVGSWSSLREELIRD